MVSPKTPPDHAPPVATRSEPRLLVSFLGFKIDGSGAAGARFAFWIALVVCGLAAFNLVQRLGG